MINIKGVKQYCKDDLSLIENYEEALNSPETWDCHHRLETELNLSREELIEQDLYLNRPASELIFLTKAEHTRLHQTGEKNSMYGKPGTMLGKTGKDHPYYGHKHTPEYIEHMSELHKGKNNPFYGHKHSEETKTRWKNRIPWNKGKKIK